MKTQIGILTIALALGGGVAYKELHKSSSIPEPAPSSSTTPISVQSAPATTMPATPTSSPAVTKSAPVKSTSVVKKSVTPKASIGVAPPTVSGGGEGHEGHEGREGREGGEDD